MFLRNFTINYILKICISQLIKNIADILMKSVISNSHLPKHVKNKERGGGGRVENISRKRMFAVGIYVRISGSCEHSGESSISRISWWMPPAAGEPAADRSRRPSSTTGPRYVRI